MISNAFVVFVAIALVLIAGFLYWIRRTQNIRLLHKLYTLLALSYVVWILALVVMKYVDPNNMTALFVLDALTNTTGSLTPTLYLSISLAFLNDWEKLPKKMWLLFGFSVFNSLVVWTNPLHHLQYQVFSVIKSEVVFGPYMFVSGTFCYICLVASIVIMINFARKNRTSKIYVRQCLLFAMGGIAPLVVSTISTVTTNLSITATPISFIFTIIFNGYGIYKLHMLDIKPMATQLVLDTISDSYLILSDKGLVVSYNKPFADTFAARYGLREGGALRDFRSQDANASNTVIYNLMAAVDSCRESRSVISYEQAITTRSEKGSQRAYYITEVSPVILNERLSGFVITYKDVTQLKNSMQEVQDSQARMMEQERLAFLGQMIGGLAHNLKTPIMSISGCIASGRALVDECRASLDDPQVVREDYLEMYDEMEDWLKKTQEATAYMSEIITAIKGQATKAANTESSVFTVDEMFKRVELLMRHELKRTRHTLKVEYNDQHNVCIQGDINHLIQVLDNLLSNAIQAQKEPGEIVLAADADHEYLKICVKDRGPGVSEQAKGRLFKEMFTSKGIHGTGLGLYISQAVIHGNFGGTLWYEDNPGGGAIFGMSIPLERTTHPYTIQHRGESK